MNILINFMYAYINYMPKIVKYKYKINDIDNDKKETREYIRKKNEEQDKFNFTVKVERGVFVLEL